MMVSIILSSSGRGSMVLWSLNQRDLVRIEAPPLTSCMNLNSCATVFQKSLSLLVCVMESIITTPEGHTMKIRGNKHVAQKP